MSLLPSRGPETSTSQDGELQIVGVDEDISSVLDALSSETAREILNAVYDDPGTPSELADRLGMSIQKVSYHLEKLEDQELITVAGTQYSEKGQEMSVYEPPDDPLVLFVGTPDRKSSLRSLVERLVPAIGILTAASAVVQFLLGNAAQSPDSTAPTVSMPTPAPTDGGQVRDTVSTPTPESTSGDGGGVSIMESTDTPSPTDSPELVADSARETTETAVTAASSGGFDVEPGVAFFLGGLLVVAVFTTMWVYSDLS